MFILSDRVKESSITEGNVNYITLNDTFGGFQSFREGIGDNNTTYYTIENNDQFEVGIGTYQEETNTLYRDQVLASSNNDELIVLLGVSVVFCTYPADKSFFLNPSGYAQAQDTYYSGIQFPDSGIQYHAINGSGSPDLVTFWKEPRVLTGDENLKFSVTNNTFTVGGISQFDSDVNISGNLTVAGTQFISNTEIINTSASGSSFVDTTFYREDAGSFFHAYVDNDYDNTIALHSTNEFCTLWKFGVKDFSPAFESAPTRGYVFGDCERVGGVVNSPITNPWQTPTHYVLNDVNGFWVSHVDYDTFNSQRGSPTIPFSNRAFSSISTVTPLGVVAAVSQSADLTIWIDALDQVLAKVYADGKASFNCYEFPDGTEQCTAFTKDCIIINQESALLRYYDFVFLEVNSSFDLYLSSASDVDCGTTMVIKRKRDPADNDTNDYIVNILPKIDSNQTIDGYDSFAIPYVNQSITLVSDGQNWQII